MILQEAFAILFVPQTCSFLISSLLWLQDEVQSQRDDLQRQREVLQRQIDLFEQQKSQWLRSVASGSPRGVDSREGSPCTRGGLQPSVTSIGHSPTGQLTVEMPLHKRSSSDELRSARSSPENRLANNAKNMSHNAPGSAEVTRRESTREIPLPANLLSATNEQKLSQAAAGAQKQFPFKLGDGATGATTVSAAGATSTKQAGTSGVQQMLPYKLLSGLTTGSTTMVASSSVSAMTNNTNAGMSVVCSQAGRSVTRTNSSGVLQNCVQTPSVVAAKTRSHSAVSLMHGSSHTPVAPQPTAINMLPMKLAQRQRPKSASASIQSVKNAGAKRNHSVVALPKSTETKEPEIIYL